MFAPIPQRALESVATDFFEYSRQRYQILLNRRAGLPREEWTSNSVLKEWSFCNVFREDDATTIWFRDNIREPLRDDPRVLMATIAFRWFNRIGAGEVIRDLVMANNWDFTAWREELNKVKARDGVVCTGAYMIKTPAKLSKVDGILQCLAQAKVREQEFLDAYAEGGGYSERLEWAWEALCTLPYMGGFTSYEVITDLRHTALLENASDIMTWANPGPGCAAGLGQMFCRDPKAYNRHNNADREFMVYLMQELLRCSQDERFWPQAWPKWEMRDVEHGSCEMFKYLKALTGKRLKRRYRSTENAISQ